MRYVSVRFHRVHGAILCTGLDMETEGNGSVGAPRTAAAAAAEYNISCKKTPCTEITPSQLAKLAHPIVILVVVRTVSRGQARTKRHTLNSPISPWEISAQL